MVPRTIRARRGQHRELLASVPHGKYRIVMPSEQPDQLIQFLCAPGSNDPPPFPAVRNMPEWLKKIPQEVEIPEHGTHSTIKRCAPFVEAISCGYIIPLRGSVRFTMPNPQQLDFQHLDFINTGDVVMGQSPWQYEGAPFSGVLKFVNHWIIKTPPGYSTLFLPVLNQPNFPFQVFAGVVETDTWFRPVHFPALSLMRPGTTIVADKGAPLAQAIPFKRDAWTSQIGTWDPQQEETARRALQTNLHVYREEHWQRKQFG
jgi:hypothetical protein